MVRLAIAPGVVLWRAWLDASAQGALLDAVMAGVAEAPFYHPVMPKSGAPFSVEETNFGALGWISERSGYRYGPTHPVTRESWPPIPPLLLQLWKEVAEYDAPPQCCLVNLYRDGAKMGLHQDRDEAATDAPVLSVSLGDSAVFRIGG
ncbi:MAG TPA: alpha-ketoglutarate-dependent dioxygenase AlkB, partial [Rhizomicrobium sp.]|nr:alpha-ketoglutarate-dependent dioxygenase AlkB [Rhizomicrobium sp.]